MRRKRKHATAPGRRNNLLARVHIAKKQLGLDDPAYRAMLSNGWGVETAARLAPAELESFCNALEREAKTGRYSLSPREDDKAEKKAASFGGNAPSGGTKGGENNYPGRPANIGPKGSGGRSDQLRKIEALLAEAGRPWGYADALARNICKTEKVSWVADRDLYKITAALVRDAQRHGRRVK